MKRTVNITRLNIKLTRHSSKINNVILYKM